MSEQNQHAEELFDKLSKDKKKRRRKFLRTVIIIIVIVAVALVITVSLLRRNVERRFASAAAEVQEYQVTTGTIHTVVAGSGILTEVDLEDLTVPVGVEVTSVAVEAGDTVKKGDLLATVDLATVMTALSDLQDQMEELDDDISDAKGDEVSSSIRAGISGRVKQIFGQKDMDVSLCMAQNGALAVLSLDGYMAVDLETDALTAGEEVKVELENGSFVSGKVKSSAGGRATVLVTDNGPRLQEAVCVYDAQGQAISQGTLYIHNPLAVTGYAGTISQVNVRENARVDSWSTLFQLKNTSFSANYDSLLRDRADLEEILMELLTLYRDSALLAPMDGRISAVQFDEDGDNSAYTMMETAVLTMSPDTAMSITISIDEGDILALEEGQKAGVTVSSVSQEEVFPARVTEISKVADTSTGVTRYSAEVTLDKAPGMLPGMTADVDIQIEGVENALIIPIDALHQTSAIHFVYTEYDPELQRYGGMKEVTIGMQNDTQVEILSGLQEGDTIYYTEAPENIFSFMMGQMGGMGGMSGMGGMGGMGGTPAVRPSAGDTVTFGPGDNMPSGMGGRSAGMNRGG